MELVACTVFKMIVENGLPTPPDPKSEFFQILYEIPKVALQAREFKQQSNIGKRLIFRLPKVTITDTNEFLEVSWVFFSFTC